MEHWIKHTVREKLRMETSGPSRFDVWKVEVNLAKESEEQCGVKRTQRPKEKVFPERRKDEQYQCS